MHCVKVIDLIHEIILWLHHSLHGKVHGYPLAAVCTGVYETEWREVAFRSFDSLTPQTCGDCRANDRNRRRKLVVVVEVSSLLLLPMVATAGSVWMAYLLDSELGSLLYHGNPHCTFCPLPLYTVIWLQNRAPFPPFAICHPEVNDVILKWMCMDKVYMV